jgi:hypothetical protein
VLAKWWVIPATLQCMMLTANVMASSTGPVPGLSGVPAAGNNGAENTCVMCHLDYPLNPDGLGKMTLVGVPSTYVPGKIYALELQVSHPEANRWGFQLTAVAGKDLHGAGDFAPLAQDRTTQRVVSDIGNRVYIEHGATGKATGVGQKNTFSWRFNWTAPSVSDGDVLFYGVFNAANGDGSNGGDKIYAPNSGLLATSKGDVAPSGTVGHLLSPPTRLPLAPAVARLDALLE